SAALGTGAADRMREAEASVLRGASLRSNRVRAEYRSAVHDVRQQSGLRQRIETRRGCAVGRREAAAPGGWIERKPSVPPEPDLDPRVGVVIGDRPGAVVIAPVDESGRDAGGDPE